ncbi:sensor histidine kinase [Pedosphaera parvula]|uniref:histidine kinase n=1 Tax=Pedosphaera parvula (strain Ellin514) TaxID=320771 RepID=B9XF72_PEDPL|nr:ATP-binding protein [Pedosphaera parvula]EEF61570.1 integral membrane sensor signal transduction histidine kinase [Pedosphaera parvula Ellin514]
MNTQSIRFRLVVWYAGLLIGVFVLLGYFMFTGVRVYLERSLGDAQVRRAQQIAVSLLANVEKTGETPVINEINSVFAPELSDRFIRIMRSDSSVMYASRNPKDLSFDASHVPVYTGAAKAGTWRKEPVPDGKELLIAAVPYRTPDGKKFVVEVGALFDPVQAVLNRLVILVAFALTAMVIVAITGGYWLVRKALAPVDQISKSAEQITLHNLRERLPVAKTGDELERLSISLNNMIVRLEDAFQQNRRFIADASHELRTPLTIMRGELEAIVIQNQIAPEVQTKAVSILEEVERLTRIVEGLFAISRLDAGEAQKEMVRFDLAKLATNTAEQMCLLAEDKGIVVRCDNAQEVMVEGDRARMKQVVVNLLDNAIKYTPSGGKVTLSVSAQSGRASLEVEDTGIGIPAEAKPRIFERFFRVDKARSRDLGGAGLGLSIVKSICAAHGGKVDFYSTEGKGSRFVVELPLSRSNNEMGEKTNGL